MKNLTLGWPQVAVLAIVAATFLASYAFPPEVRDEIRTDLGYAWGALATLLGPVVRRKLAERDQLSGNPGELPEAGS